MEDLRPEIRAAFEKEQSEFPPAGDLRPRLARGATTHPQTQRNFQWLAAAAALMIGVLVVAGLMSSRLTNRGSVTHPKSTPSPTGDYGPPPAGVPLVYVGDANHRGWYIGVDWSGKPRGTIKLAQPLDESANLVQSPDGSAFFADDRGVSYGPPLDRLGRPQTGFPIPDGLRQLVWADDNRHLCSIAYQNGHLLLSWHVPGFTYNSAVVAQEPDPSMGIGGDIGIDACAFSTDPRAVLDRSRGLAASEYWVIHLTDGRVLAHAQIPAGVVNVVASNDGDYLAENASTAASTRVLDLSTGHVTNLNPTLQVLGFSGDDKVALVTPQGWTAGFPTTLEAIELATGHVLWTYNGGQELQAFYAEPSGSDFALTFKRAGDQALHPNVSILIERPDGTSTTVEGPFTHP